jgi:DNA-3-methyladenine glycosylase
MAAREAAPVPAERSLGLSAPRLGRRLPRSFFSRPSTDVAPDLLGRILVRRLADGTRLAVRLVEVEAYAPDDPASHAFRGPTPRNAVMFGPAGHLYVYFSYGMHWCANVVTGRRQEGSAVLLRAGEPLLGLEAMASHRGLDDVRKLCAGPGRLTQALAISREDDGADVVRDAGIAIHEGEPLEPDEIVTTTRVGISVGLEPRWRYLEAGSRWMSPGRPSVPRAERGLRRGSRGS